MSWNFKKSFKVFGGIRANFSQMGLGFSWGLPGYRVTKRPDGKIYSTTSFPGTGIYQRKTLNYGRTPSAEQVHRQPEVRNSFWKIALFSSALGFMSGISRGRRRKKSSPITFLLLLFIFALVLLSGLYLIIIYVIFPTALVYGLYRLISQVSESRNPRLNHLSVQPGYNESANEFFTAHPGRYIGGSEAGILPIAHNDSPVIATDKQTQMPATELDCLLEKSNGVVIPDLLQSNRKNLNDLMDDLANTACLVRLLQEPLKQELRRHRMASLATELLEADLRNLILHFGAEFDSLTADGANVFLAVFVPLHPRRYSCLSKEFVMKMYARNPLSAGTVLPTSLPAIPASLSYLALHDALHATQFLQTARRMFFIVATAASYRSGLLYPGKASLLDRYHNLLYMN